MKFLDEIEFTEQERQVIMGEKTPKELGWRKAPNVLGNLEIYISPGDGVAHCQGETYLRIGENYVLIAATESEDGGPAEDYRVFERISFDIISYPFQEEEVGA